jgi:hypothetical protein
MREHLYPYILSRMVAKIRKPHRMVDIKQIPARHKDMRLAVAVYVWVCLAPHHGIVDVPVEMQPVEAEGIASRLPRIAKSAPLRPPTAAAATTSGLVAFRSERSWIGVSWWCAARAKEQVEDTLTVGHL